MAKLRLLHTFKSSPESFWEMFWDPAFDDLVNASASVVSVVVSDQTDADGMRQQVVTSKPNRTLPPAVARVIGAQEISYRTTLTYYPKKGFVAWQVQPSVFADKVTAQGEIAVRAHSLGCERVVNGDISVKVRFVGGVIEKAILEDVTRSYNRAAEVATRWFEGKRA